MITVLFMIVVLTVGYLLYNLINNWYIKPYEDLMHQKRLDDIEYETIIKGKNQLINEMSTEIEELKVKLKESKKKSIKKSTKRKILEVFPLKK